MALETGLWNGTALVDRSKGLVSRDIFVDQELYEIEKERVFARSWLFVGFEDQVKKPGDYFVSRMGEGSVILSRDRDNTIHVFLNSCRHRGMKVCRYDEGNTPVFTCPYHGWSYAGDGLLVGVPRYKDAYREELDKSQWGLVEVAQMENYKGTIWATWDPKAPPLAEYLGDTNRAWTCTWTNRMAPTRTLRCLGWSSGCSHPTGSSEPRTSWAMATTASRPTNRSRSWVSTPAEDRAGRKPTI